MEDFVERRRAIQPPPSDETVAAGWPHLTWIFVAPLYAGHGTGTAMLRAVTDSVRTLGDRELASTFLHGNSSSLRWHWRNGFLLLPGPGSYRWWRHSAQIARRDVSQQERNSTDQTPTPTLPP
jgi:GNAT superfamily N-acetyltransferase